MDAQNKYMIEAIAEAKAAAARGEIPVGAVLVNGLTGEVVARSGNQTETWRDPTAHAEMLVLQEGGKIYDAPRLPECDLYVSLEPCAMCAAAISFARIRRLYFGAYDPKGGGVDHGGKFYGQPTCHHAPEVYGGIHEQECAVLLRDFFKGRR